MTCRPRGSGLPGDRAEGAVPGHRDRSGMDLGTRSLWLGAFSICTAWIPVLNIVVFVAAVMALGFGALARWPTGWLTNDEPDPRRALWGMVLGGLAIVEFAVAVAVYVD